MIKVCHVITRMIVGGAQENTLYSVTGLADTGGYEVTLVTGPETGSEGDLLGDADPSLAITRVPHLVRSIRPLSDARALHELHRCFQAVRPDIVHTHSSKAGVLGRAAARSARVPLVVHTLHSLVFHDFQPSTVRSSYRMIKRALVPLTDCYVSVSDDIRTRAIAAGIGQPDRHVTVRSGFPTDEFVSKLVPRRAARSQLGLPSDRVIIGVVGRLFPLKGHEDILRAGREVVGSCPDVLFAFVGSGPLRERLETSAREMGIADHVRFVGRVPPSDMPVVYSALDILAHASLREGLARVLPQAVLAGVPVVVYDLDGASEVIGDGVNGYLVRPRDTDGLAERLATLAKDAGLRAHLGGVGAAEIRRAFSVDQMVADLDSLYQRLLVERGRPVRKR